MQFDEVLSQVRSKLASHVGPITPEIVVSCIRQIDPVCSNDTLAVLARSIYADLVGFGPLHDLLRMDGLTDILVNGHDDVWIDSAGGLSKVNAKWRNEDDLRDFAVRLARQADRKLDHLSPFADFELSNGARCHVIIAPLVRKTHISIRIPREPSTSLTDVLKNQDERVHQLLMEIVQSRQNFLITGGTGTGKTTLLAAMLQEVPANERIVLIEDSGELNVQHPNLAGLQARSANIEGVGAIPMSVLVRQSLRMRPDRIVVGEVRGAEISDLFLALNTGHRGSAATLHANAIHHVPARVKALASLSGMTTDVADLQFAAAFNAVIHMQRNHEGSRIVCNVAQIRANSVGSFELHEVLSLAQGSATDLNISRLRTA
ncbi:MAG: TadA family conjugal transfer-associated ATPase [Actinobacteria bacterium]|uniref:Unannotated protein n=1 Tax=freshwater metagenome TaxID=449393 RepID=A0A6J5YVW8_9ZZZZ|nr:TadA family conjugal transfer-associated ATPase [Actinomycetota bacterium]